MTKASGHDAPLCRIRLEPERHDELHADLDHWRANVGDPVCVDCAARAPASISGVDVLCWNIAIGLGRLDQVLDRLRTDSTHRVGVEDSRPLVILVQEAFRSDGSVPEVPGGVHHGGKVPGTTRTDIVEIARTHGLALRYSPSMRNGSHPSDRGNAILSTVQLTDAHAFLLPYVRQRRVVVTARIAGHDALAFASAHLDTHGRPRSRGGPTGVGAGRAAQARALAERLRDVPGSLVLGADLNSMFGMSDPAVRELVAGGMHPARRVGNWRHTFHTRLRLLLDHVLYRCDDRRIRGCEVTRIDEAPGDRTRGVFGSDHHPLLARFDLVH